MSKTPDTNSSASTSGACRTVQLIDWLGFPVLIFGTLALLAGFMVFPELHELDIRLADWMRLSKPPELQRNIVLIDVPSQRPDDIKGFRQNLGALLQELASRKSVPSQVALDVRFDASGVEAVERGVSALHAREVPVHGACPKRAGRDPHNECESLISEATHGLYKKFYSRGHTYFMAHVSAPFYRLCSPVRSMVFNMATTLGSKPECEEDDEFYVQMGDTLERQASDQLLSYDATCTASKFRYFQGECLTKPPVFKDATVIVGRMAFDRSPHYASRSGPELIAWAVNDQLLGNKASVVTGPYMHLVLSLCVACVGLLLFYLSIRFFRLWRLKPWRIAAVSALGAALALVVIMLALKATDRYYTQVTLPLLFTVVVLASATIFRMRSTQNEDHAIGSRTAHEFLAYDVFISYRSPRRHIVKDVLMVALAGLVRADGSKLNIFWDNKSLHRGDFEPQLQRAILESRVFVALLTSEYFDIDRPYCRWEMKTAKGSGKEIVLIIGDAQYDPQNPPEEFSWLKPLHHYNLDDEDFAEKFRKEVGAAEANYGKRITSS